MTPLTLGGMSIIQNTSGNIMLADAGLELISLKGLREIIETESAPQYYSSVAGKPLYAANDSGFLVICTRTINNCEFGKLIEGHNLIEALKVF